MSYNINPCKACWQKYKNGDCNINELNDCVVDTSTAFSTFPSNNSLRGNLKGQNWQDCIAQKLAELPYVAGKPRSFCNFQVNTAPRLLQIPHYYPELLEKTQDPKKALKMCHQMCQGDRLSETCKETCECDHSAVEDFSPNKTKTKKVRFADTCDVRGLNSASVPAFTPGGCLKSTVLKEKFSREDDKPEPQGPTFRDEAKAHPVAFWIPFVIVAILLALVLVGFGAALFSRKIGTK